LIRKISRWGMHLMNAGKNTARACCLADSIEYCIVRPAVEDWTVAPSAVRSGSRADDFMYKKLVCTYTMAMRGACESQGLPVEEAPPGHHLAQLARGVVCYLGRL
jgi:hypothetical protein